MKITINNITVALSGFDYGCFRELSRQWGLKGVGETSRRLTSGEVDDFDGCVDLVHAAIVTSGVKGADTITVTEVGNYFMRTPSALADTLALIKESFPQPEADDAGKPIAAEAPQE